MKKIQMVDLGAQYQQFKTQIDKNIAHVIQNTAFINGPEVKEFASQLAAYAHVKHVIPCANGTDALHLALMALDMPPGSEIIIPAFTYVSAVEAAALLDFKPVFVDVDPDTFNVNTVQIEEKITSDTKAIAVVHLFGQCADMQKILAIAEKHQLHVIEDAAQSIGSRYYFPDGTSKMAGTMGDIGITSFFPSKNLGCYGDGGAVFTNHEQLAGKIRAIANHGQERKYYHDMVGVNSRLDTLQAAVLLAKLPHLDEFNALRRKAADYYDEALTDIQGIERPQRAPYSDHVFHQYTVKVPGIERDNFRSFLREHDIPTMIYYPVPMHLQKAYSKIGFGEGDFPVAEKLCRQVVSLPMHPDLEKEQLTYITEHILRFFKEYSIEK